MMTATLSVEETGRKCISLVNFSNGKLQRENAGDLNIGLLNRTDTLNARLKEQKIMVAETKPMTYVGRNFGETITCTGQGLCSYYVGVYDPETGKMRVCDTEMFTMQPQLASQDELDTGQSDITFMEKSDMLTSAFGSSKKRRTMEARQRQTVEENVLKGVLNSAIGEGISQAHAHKAKQDETTTDAESLVPPRDVVAKNVEDVYQLKDLLSSEDLDALHNCAKVFVESDREKLREWRDNDEYPLYVLSRLAVLTLDEGRRLHRCKCLMYLSYLIHLYRMRSQQMKVKDPLPSSWPLAIQNKLFGSFTLMVMSGKSKRRCLPSRLKDKLLNYILTLCLILDKFSLDVCDLYKDLKIGQGKMSTHLRILGCVINKKKVDKSVQEIAVLKVPFRVPEVHMQRKGKR